MDDEVLGHLVHFKKNGEPGEPYPIYTGETTIGTDPNADVRIKKKDFSLELIHCVIHVNNNGTASLVNKSDNNPVKINGVIIRREQVLKDYDIFEIDNKKFQYSKIVSKFAKEKVQSTPSHKRYTMFTSSAVKATPRQTSNNGKTPRSKRTSVVTNVIKNANKSAGNSIVDLKASKNHNASFETQLIDNSDVKPDTRDHLVERPKTTSKITTRRMLGSPAPLRRRLSLTLDQIHVSNSPKATVSSRNLLLGDHLITAKADNFLKLPKSAAKRSSKSGYETPKTPNISKSADVKTPKLQKPSKNTPKSNKKLVTPVKSSPFAKTPHTQKISLKITPKSNVKTVGKKTPVVKTPKSSSKLELSSKSLNRVREALTEMTDKNLISFDSPMMHDRHNLSIGSKTNTPGLVLIKTPRKNSLTKTPTSATKISKKTPLSARKSSNPNIRRTLEHLVCEGSDKNVSPAISLERSRADTPNSSNVTTEHFVNLSNISEKYETSSPSLTDTNNRSARRSQTDIDRNPDVHRSSSSKRSSVRTPGVAKIVQDCIDAPLLVNRPKRSNRFSLRASKDDSMQGTDSINISSRSSKHMSNDGDEQDDTTESTRNESKISNKSSHVMGADDDQFKPNNSSRSSLQKSNIVQQSDYTPEQLVEDRPRRSNRSSLLMSHIECTEDVGPAELSVANQSGQSNVSGLHKSRVESQIYIDTQELSVSNTSRRSNRLSLQKSYVTSPSDVQANDDAQPEEFTQNTERRSHRSSLHNINKPEDIQQDECSNTSQHLSGANNSRGHLQRKSTGQDTSRFSNKLSLCESFSDQGGEERLTNISCEDLDGSSRNVSKSSERSSLPRLSIETSTANISKHSVKSSRHNSYIAHSEEYLCQEELSSEFKNCSDEVSLNESYTDSCESSFVDEPSIGTTSKRSSQNTSKRSSRSLINKSCVDGQEDLNAEDTQSDDKSINSKRTSFPVADPNNMNISKRSNRSMLHNSHAESQANDVCPENTNTSRQSKRLSHYKSGIENVDGDMSTGNKPRGSFRLSVNKDAIEYLQDNEAESPRRESPVKELSESNTRHSRRSSVHKDAQNDSRHSNRTPNVSGHDTCQYSSVDNLDQLDLPGETAQTANLLSSSQYSMISEASVSSSGRVIKTPSKFKDSVCSFTSNSSVKKTPKSKMTGDDSTLGGLTSNVKDDELVFDGTASSTPHHRRSSRGLNNTPRNRTKQNRSVSFIESTPIPKQIGQVFRSSSLQNLNDSDITRVSQRSTNNKSKSYSVISILDDSTTDEVEPSEMWKESVPTSPNMSGRNTHNRSKLGMSASPLDSLIVNVDSDTDLPSESFQNKRSKTPSGSSSIKNNSSVVNDSANFATPENNISVIELSDDCLTPNSHLKRPKSKSIGHIPDQGDAYGTPKNTNQFDEGFKTPLNTPALFESLKKSVVRSRKHLNNSASLREENVNSSFDEASSISTDMSEAYIHEEISSRRLSADAQIMPVVGVKRGRESTGSVLRCSKKKKVAHHYGYQPRASLNFDTSSEKMSEGSLDASTESCSSISDGKDTRNLRGHSKLTRSCLSLTDTRPKRTMTRRSLQDIKMCEYEDPALQNKLAIDLPSTSVSSESEDLPVYLNEHASSDTSKRHTKVLSTSYSNINNSIGSKKSVRNSSPSDTSHVRGVENRLKTPRQVKSPHNDLSDVRGVRNLMKTPTDIKSPRNDLTDVRGIRYLMKTPRHVKSPRNDLTDVRGVKKLLKTPRLQKSPKNDLRDVRGVKRLVKIPRKQRSPKNDLTDVKGVKSLLRSPKTVKSPKNDLTAVRGIKQMFASPRIQRSPKNDLTNVVGIKRLLRSPKVLRSPNNDLSDLRGVKQLYRTPRVRKEPYNDLTDVDGLKRMYLVEEATARRRSMNTSGIDVLFQTRENQSDIENLDLFSHIHKKPLRTYRGKSFSPKKYYEDKCLVRKTLGDIPMNSPHVETWVEEQIKYTQKKTKRGMAGMDNSKSSEDVVVAQPASSSRKHEVELANEKESDKNTVAQQEPSSKTKRTRVGKALVESPRIASRHRKLVVEIEPLKYNAVEKGELLQNTVDNVENDQTIKKRKGRQPAKSKANESNVMMEEASSDANITEANNAAQETTSRQTRKPQQKSNINYDKSKESENSNDEPIARQTRKCEVMSPIKAPEEKNVRTRRGKKLATSVVGKEMEESEIDESESKLTRPRRAGKKPQVKFVEDDSAEDSNDEDYDSHIRKAKTVTKKRTVKSVNDHVNVGPKTRKGQKLTNDDSGKSYEEDSELTTSSNKPRRGRRRNNEETVITVSPTQDTDRKSSDNNSGRARRTRKVTKTVEVAKTETVEQTTVDIEKPSRSTRQKRGQKLLEQTTPITSPRRPGRKVAKKEYSEAAESELTPKRGRKKALETTFEGTPLKKSTRTTRKNQIIDKVETPKNPAKKVVEKKKRGKQTVNLDTESDSIIDKVVQPARRTRRKVLENVDAMPEQEANPDVKQKVVEAQIIRKSTRTRKN